MLQPHVHGKFGLPQAGKLQTCMNFIWTVIWSSCGRRAPNDSEIINSSIIRHRLERWTRTIKFDLVCLPTWSLCVVLVTLWEQFAFDTCIELILGLMGIDCRPISAPQTPATATLSKLKAPILECSIWIFKFINLISWALHFSYHLDDCVRLEMFETCRLQVGFYARPNYHQSLIRLNDLLHLK